MEQVNMDVDNIPEDVWSPLVEQRFNLTPNPITRTQLPAFDAELVLANKAYVMAKKRRNMLAPACRIPAEILSAIFAFAQLDWKPEFSREGKTYKYDLGWTHISHVCEKWRNVAIQTPSLWTKIDCLALPQRAAFWFYRRSRNLPLSLTLGTNMGSYNLDKLKTVVTPWLTQIICPRIESLIITDCTAEDMKIITHVCTQPMPNLSYLEVSPELDGQETTPRLPLRFCPEARPARVTLSGCVPHWNATFLSPSLTHLTLHASAHVSPDWMPFWDRFADLISSLHILQELSLCDVFPIIIPSLPQDTLMLPSTLRQLKLNASDYNYSCLELLLHVTIPPTCQVIVEMRDIDENQHVENISASLKPVLSMLHRIQGIDAPPGEIVMSKDSLDFYADELHRGNWTVGPILDTLFLDTSPSRIQPQVQILVQSADTLPLEQSASLTLCRHLLSLPLHNLSALSLSVRAINDLAGSDDWSLLRTASGVRRLGLYISSSRLLIDALRDRGTSGGFILFPVLQVVHVHLEIYEKTPDPDLEARCRQDTLALVSLARARKEGDAPLQEVVIQKRISDWEDWEALRLIVPVTFNDFST